MSGERCEEKKSGGRSCSKQNVSIVMQKQRSSVAKKWLECGKMVKRNLEVHMSIHKKDRTYSCATCYEKFNEKRCLTAHMRSHSGEGRG